MNIVLFGGTEKRIMAKRYGRELNVIFSNITLERDDHTCPESPQYIILSCVMSI